MILLYHNVYLERRKTIISFLITEWSLFIKPRVPFTQECFVPSFDEIGPVVLERKIFKFRQYIFAISLLSPLGKGRFPTFERTRLPFTKGCFVLHWLKLACWFLRRRWKMWTVYRQTTVDRWSECSLELSAQVS